MIKKSKNQTKTGEPGGNRTHNPQIKKTTGDCPRPSSAYFYFGDSAHERLIRPPISADGLWLVCQIVCHRLRSGLWVCSSSPRPNHEIHAEPKQDQRRRFGNRNRDRRDLTGYRAPLLPVGVVGPLPRQKNVPRFPGAELSTPAVSSEMTCALSSESARRH